MAATIRLSVRRSFALMASVAFIAGSTLGSAQQALAQSAEVAPSGTTAPATPTPPAAPTAPDVQAAPSTPPAAPQPAAPAAPAPAQAANPAPVAPAAPPVAASPTAPQPAAPAPEAPAPAQAVNPAPVAPPAPPVVASPAVANGPASVADLAQGLLGAVVNISTSQKVKDEGVGPSPKVPEGSPFQDFFNDFFKNRNGQSNNHKVSSLGSGFVIDPKGYIVTNNHVIEGADDIEVTFPSGNKLKARLIGTDTKTDLSVLKVEPKQPLTSVHFGDSSTMRIGDWVMAIGNPFGLGGSVTVGIVSARGRNINAGPYDNFIQTDAAINKGNSGGPLFNMKGEVIGINTAIISPSGGSIGIGFAVPSELASGVVAQLMDFGETRRGWLGVRIQPVTDDVAQSLGLDAAKGALVAGVIKGGPVDNGSIKAGDVILKFDGKVVNEMRDLPRVVAESPVGKEVDVEIMRDGKQQTVKVTLGRLEDSNDKAAAADTDNSAPGLAPDDNGNDDGNGVINPDQGDEGDDSDGQDQGDQQQNPAPQAVQNVLGMKLQALNADNRKSFGIADSVDGVVIMEIAPGSAAGEKGLKAGDVIVEVAQEFMQSPGAVLAKVNTLKKEGRRNAQMMIASANGDLRFIAVPLE
ncbi:Do family serine endopeptidase [Rhizobium sp. BK376]|uniref:Do family serine endopeptidase n=1 Tax=Rhizobium sp. BK376 TaxID=2512149 RepID=UPI0010E71057|nr:Do family serine endopeptidase [Rhizobium sp. BK376]TCR83545.1 serine protease Do [Rhizobium sp. BK376]